MTSDKLYRIKLPLAWYRPFPSEVPNWWKADSPIGHLSVSADYLGRWYWSNQHTVSLDSQPCESLAHGKALAEAWYVERMREGLEEVPQAEVNHEAMDRLEKWNRKGYHFDIRNSGNFQPGDGCGVTLKCSWMDGVKHPEGGRKVDAFEDEMIRWASDDDEDGKDYFPTIAEVILEALKKWEAKS